MSEKLSITKESNLSFPISSSLYCSIGSEKSTISDEEIKTVLHSFLDSMGARDDVLILPPDYTRFHSQAGKITRFVCEYYNFVKDGKTCDDIIQHVKLQQEDGQKEKEPKSKKSKLEKSKYNPSITILPALGTHVPMTITQIESMFGKELSSKEPNPFLVHNWREDVVTIGYAPSQMVCDATNGQVNRPWPAQLNKLVWEKRKIGTSSSSSSSDNNTTTKQKHKSLILSIGQVVPHEVMGMANFNKNLFVGVGGVEAINLSHFIGAVHGMERMMGRASNPLREILNYASENYLQKELDLWYILTVMGVNDVTGDVEMRGFYIGNDIQCYNLACDLSLKVNFTMLERAPKKVVVHLDKDEFHSTWLGNKAIYRTRMAIADGGELIILAPGVKQFGEDGEIDKLIRDHGYVGTPKILEAMEKNPELQANLSAVAHLIHGSSEGRFRITYCPGNLTEDEIKSVGFQYESLEKMSKKYDSEKLKDGWNEIKHDDGAEKDASEEIYFISNPALGLWAVPSRFDDSQSIHDNVKPTTTVDTENTQSHVQNNTGDVGGWKKPPST